MSETVAIIDWNEGGHHGTYLLNYSANLAALGARVLVMTAEGRALDELNRQSGCRAVSIPSYDWIKRRRWITPWLARRAYVGLLVRTLRDAENRYGIHCQRFLLGCLYENHTPTVCRLFSNLNLPCAAIYIHSGVFHAGGGKPQGKRAAAVTAALRHPALERIFLPDESMAAAVAAHSRKPVSVVPDFTDATVDPNWRPPPGYPPDKPVVGLLGHLRPNKGTALMARIVVEHPEVDAFFLFAGDLPRGSHTPEEWAMIERAKQRPDRALFLPGHLREGHLNALLRTCEVVWVLYPNNPHSANLLTKAAIFHKPVLAAEGTLTGLRTARHRMGLCADWRNSAAVAEALQSLIDPRNRKAVLPNPDWNGYAARHSRQALAEPLADWLAADRAG